MNVFKDPRVLQAALHLVTAPIAPVALPAIAGYHLVQGLSNLSNKTPVIEKKLPPNTPHIYTHPAPIVGKPIPLTYFSDREGKALPTPKNTSPLFGSYTVQTNKTPTEIAKDLNISVQELQKWNPDFNFKNLYNGKVLNYPKGVNIN